MSRPSEIVNLKMNVFDAWFYLYGLLLVCVCVCVCVCVV